MFGPFLHHGVIVRGLYSSSRALEAQVNTLLFASLHIHEGHRGIRCSFFVCFLFRSVVG